MIDIHVHTDIGSNTISPDSTNKIPDLVAMAKKLGRKACAITDHGTISGHQQFWNECNKQEIKPILGIEGYLDIDDGKSYHIILLAKDMKGLVNIQRLSSMSWLNNFQYRPRIKLEWLLNFSDGLIVSDACLGGVIKKYTIKTLEGEEGAREKLKELITTFKNTFKDDFYLELQANELPEQEIINEKLLQLSKAYKIKTIVSTDIHYLRPENKETHKIFLSSSEDSGRETGNFYDHTYMMTEEEIHQILDLEIGYDNVELCIKNTDEIYNKIGEYSLKGSPILPNLTIAENDFQLKGYFDNKNYEFIQKFLSSSYLEDKFWLYLIEKGHLENIKYNKEKYENEIYLERINKELGIIWDVSETIGTRLSKYYAGLADDIETIKSVNCLIGVGRGSAGGFYTVYCGGITQIDPLDYNLPEWRHLHESRPELPDIDIDLEPQLINKVFDALEEKHGANTIIRVCTFKTMTTKSAIGASGRGLGIDVNEVMAISNLIPDDRGKLWTLDQCLNGDESKDYKPIEAMVEASQRFPELFKYAKEMEGLTQGRSKHASAVYIYDRPYWELNAAMRTPNGTIVTQMNMYDSDERGATKYDFLVTEQQTLKHLTLDQIDKSDRNINEKYDNILHPRVLNLNDKNVYENIFNLGKTRTIFQWGSDIGMSALKELKPNSIYDLSAGNNIIRLIGDFIPMYVSFKENPNLFYEKYSHLTEREMQVLTKVLASNNFVSIMQEDIMRLSIEVGFDMKQANGLRKGVAKKKPKILKEIKEELKEVGMSNNFSEIFMEELWNDFIEPLAGYGFSINHSVPYSIEGYQDAWLLNYYPLEWFKSYLSTVTGILDVEEESNKGTDYAKLSIAISNIIKEGYKVLPPDINYGTNEPDILDGGIMLGLKTLSNLNKAEVVDQIILNRPYSSFKDFIERQVINPPEGYKKISKKVLFSLIGAGSFDRIENGKRKELFVDYIRYTHKDLKSISVRNIDELKEIGLLRKELDKDQSSAYIKENKEYFLDELNKNRKNNAWNELRQKELKGSPTDWEFNAIKTYLGQNPFDYINKLSIFSKLSEDPEFELIEKERNGIKYTYPQYSKYYTIGGTVLDKNAKKRKILIVDSELNVVTVRFSAWLWGKFQQRIEVGEKFGFYGVRKKGEFIACGQDCLIPYLNLLKV